MSRPAPARPGAPGPSRPAAEPPAHAAIGRAALRLTAVAGPAARLEAERLAAAASGMSRARLLAEARAPLAPRAQRAFERAVARRAAGEPLAYVLGHAPFLDFDVAVDPAVLIPRPETELLAEWAIDAVRRRAPDGEGVRVLDVGTGSGVLAIAVARACPRARVVATETSRAALKVAAANARALGVDARVAFEAADLWPHAVPPFDVVVANLPYVGTDELADVAPDVLAWEPHRALFAGPDGLALCRRLAAEVGAHLRPEGAVGLEVGWRQAADVAVMLRDGLPGHAVGVRVDDAGIERFVVGSPAAGR